MRDVFVDTIDTDTIETVTSLVGLVSPSPTLVPPPSAPNNNNNNNPPGHPPSSQPGILNRLISYIISAFFGAHHITFKYQQYSSKIARKKPQ